MRCFTGLRGAAILQEKMEMMASCTGCANLHHENALSDVYHERACVSVDDTHGCGAFKDWMAQAEKQWAEEPALKFGQIGTRRADTRDETTVAEFEE